MLYNIKDFNFRLEDIDPEGMFSGYASVFNVVDAEGDMVVPGAFNNISQDEIKLLWQHDPSEPIGKILHVKEDAHGLFVKAQLLLDVRRAKEAHSLLKEGAIQGLSIGYTIIKQKFTHPNSLRVLNNLRLWEVSLVTFPCNAAAKVTDVKNMGSASSGARRSADGAAEALMDDVDSIIAYLSS